MLTVTLLERPRRRRITPDAQAPQITKPAFVPVLLGGGAVFRVRPATSTDVDYAAARAQRDLAGFAAGSDAADALESVLGDGFSVGALKTADGIAAATIRMSEVYLVDRCHDGWTGVATEDGEPIPHPDVATIALLLADPVHRQRIMHVINAGVHEEDPGGKRIRRLAEWRGGHPDWCANCRRSGEPCASGLAIVDAEGALTRCPEIENAPQTREGRAVAAILGRPGVWHRSGMDGVLSGLDWPAALASLPGRAGRRARQAAAGRGGERICERLAGRS